MFARPQQKSDPTEVNENNGVDPLPSEVCAEPVREKGTAKGEKCDRKTQRTVHLLGVGLAGNTKECRRGASNEGDNQRPLERKNGL